MYPLGTLPLKKNGGGKFFLTPLGSGVVEMFPSNRPWKGVSKTGFKILAAHPNKFEGWEGVKVSPEFRDFPTFSPISPQRSKISPFTNLKTDYQTTDTSLRYGEKMVYFGPP